LGEHPGGNRHICAQELLLGPKATLRLWRLYGQPVKPLPDYAEAFSPCGAAATYRTEWFTRVSGFDERFFCYIEDIDLAFRIRLLAALANREAAFCFNNSI
jgi:GT2 family glycosyltransferase